MPRKPPTVGARSERKAWDHGKRESRHKRGYGTAWDKLRKEILERDKYLCQPCRRGGQSTVAKMVDHIKPKAKGGTDDPGNLQSICAPCHLDKTLRENGKRRKKRIGVDGWPVGK